MNRRCINLPKVDVSRVPALFIPSAPDVAFEGFKPEAFEVLDRLKEHPHIECYREQRATIEEFIKTPFKRYRDDLVVNVVLPNGLNLETERNVFSRLLKNDFGAGGCHHHKWLSFHRPDRRRITDIQLAHSLSPEGLRISVYAGRQAKGAFETARRHVLADPASFLALVNPLLLKNKYHFAYHHGAGTSKTLTTIHKPLAALPDDVATSRGFAVRTLITREDVLELQSDLMPVVFKRMTDLWPVYRLTVS